jgi:hypothetical protein
MKYVPTRKGYVSLKPRVTGGAVNLLNELEDKPSALPPPPQNTISGVIREPAPLLRGGDLISSLQKINFSKNTKDNKRKNIIFSP